MIEEYVNIDFTVDDDKETQQQPESELMPTEESNDKQGNLHPPKNGNQDEGMYGLISYLCYVSHS